MCGRWKAAFMAMAVRPCAQFLDDTQNLMNKVAYIIPYCAKAVHNVPHCDKDIIMSNILCMPPTSPFQLQGYMSILVIA